MKLNYEIFKNWHWQRCGDQADANHKGVPSFKSTFCWLKHACKVDSC